MSLSRFHPRCGLQTSITISSQCSSLHSVNIPPIFDSNQHKNFPVTYLNVGEKSHLITDDFFCFQSPTSLPPASSRSMQWRLTLSSSASSSTPRTMMEALRNLITCQKVWWRFSVWKIRQSMQNNHCLFYFAVKAKNKSGLFHVRHM